MLRHRKKHIAFDLNLPIHGDNCTQRLDLLKEFGYGVVALNEEFDCTKVSKSKRRKLEPQMMLSLNTGGVRLLRRVTLVLSDDTDCAIDCSAFDLIGIATSSAASLSCLPSEMNVSLYRPLVTAMSHQQIDDFIDALPETACVELCYSDLLNDSSIRHSVIECTRLLVQRLPLRRFVLTSGSDLWQNIRSPYDASSLATLFGVPRHATTINERTSTCTKAVFAVPSFPI